jgi:hypothetical protein
MVFSRRMRNSRVLTPPRVPQVVTLRDPFETCTKKNVSLPVLGDQEKPAVKLSCLFYGVVEPLGHALALTLTHRRDQSRAPSLRWRYGRHPQRYYEPLGLPPDSLPFRTRLIGRVFAGRRRSGRVSPVPCRAFTTCPPPYPGNVLHRSGSTRCSLLPSPWNERLGHPTLSGIYLTGLQGSLHAGPEALLPSQKPYGSLRAFDIPLRREDLSPRPGSATRRAGAYRGGTLTR